MEILTKKQQRHIRLRNVIVFTEAIFGEKELVFGSVVGGGGRGAEGRQRMEVLSLCVLQLRVFLH